MKEIIKNIKIIYGSIMGGATLFLVVVCGLIFSGITMLEIDSQLVRIIEIVSTILAGVFIYAGIIVFNRRKDDYINLPLDEKIAAYKSAMIVRAATMEGSMLMLVIFFLLTGHFLILSEAILCLGIMAFYFPTNARISNETNLDFNQMN